MDYDHVTVIEDTMVHRGASGDSQTWGPAEACRQFKLLDTKLHNKVYLRIEYDSPAKQGFIDSTKAVIGDASECGANYPPSGSVLPKVLPEDNFIFYYHPDHLGSTGYMTDRIGRVYEHLQYTPWGETWVEQRRGKDLFPKYQFTGKELDPETNLYYFGARYYDPQTSVWASVDPMLSLYLPHGGKDRMSDQANQGAPLIRTRYYEPRKRKWIPATPINKFINPNRPTDTELPGMGGIYISTNLNTYIYGGNNPLIVIDTTGLFNELVESIGVDIPSGVNLRLNAEYASALRDSELNLEKHFEKVFAKGGLFDYANNKYGEQFVEGTTEKTNLHRLGNLNFGIMMAAAGYDLDTTLWIAGFARQFMGGDKPTMGRGSLGLFQGGSEGNLIPIYPYGNIPAAAQDVRLGFKIYLRENSDAKSGLFGVGFLQ